MSPIFLLLIFWALFVIGVYAHFYYEVKARYINFSEKLTQLRDTLTEEE